MNLLLSQSGGQRFMLPALGVCVFHLSYGSNIFVLYILAGTQRNSYFVAAISVYYIIAVINIQQRLGEEINVILY